MMRLVAMALAILLPAQAFALSCTPWHIEDAYQAAKQSDADYIVFRGEITFDPDELPKVDWDRQDRVPPQTRIEMQFSGHLLSNRKAQDRAIEGTGTLVVRCLGPWCSSPVQGDTLAFLQKTESGYTVDTVACAGMMFHAPDAKTMRKVRRCLRGAECKSQWH